MCNDAFMAQTDTMGGRLRWAREQAGYADAAAFARVVKVHATTYRAYENDQNAFAKRAPEFAAKLGVPTDWLLRGGPMPAVNVEAARIVSEVAPTGILDPRAEKYGSEVLEPIPLLGTAMAGEWSGPDKHIELTELDLGEILDQVARPLSMVADRNAYAVTIVGDSMWPRFRPGRRVIVSPRAPVSIGDDVILQLLGPADDGGERRVVMVLIKELVRRSAAYVELRQFNPDITFKVPIDQIAGLHKVAGELF